LSEEDITDFVNCLKECAFISIFNKNHLDIAADTCHYLSQLRPELIVPPLVELFVSRYFLLMNYLIDFLRHFSSIDNMTEPHRFTSIITCLAGMTRQIVRQTADFSQGQTFVLPLLMSVLPGIDSNDFKKTSITFQFLNSILMLITCVDCSSAVNTRTDLSEVRIILK
jgi:proteasome activator subunit 4